jgi:phage N-6-adenine-methyltransferase
MAKMPAQKPGKSKQDYATPRPFLDAVEARFGRINFDLAASAHNKAVDAYFDERKDSLQQTWCRLPGLLWLNPPFGNIDPWAEKCAAEMRKGARIAFLTPASVGANWFQAHVVPSAHVLELSPRLSFDGEHPFPKDLVLAIFYAGLTGRSPWRWRWR